MSDKQEKSVIKSAIIGGVIAGPAGAVVGAIDSLDKNNALRANQDENTKTVIIDSQPVTDSRMSADSLIDSKASSLEEFNEAIDVIENYYRRMRYYSWDITATTITNDNPLTLEEYNQIVKAVYVIVQSFSSYFAPPLSQYDYKKYRNTTSLVTIIEECTHFYIYHKYISRKYKYGYCFTEWDYKDTEPQQIINFVKYDRNLKNLIDDYFNLYDVNDIYDRALAKFIFTTSESRFIGVYFYEDDFGNIAQCSIPFFTLDNGKLLQNSYAFTSRYSTSGELNPSINEYFKVHSEQKDKFYKEISAFAERRSYCEQCEITIKDLEQKIKESENILVSNERIISELSKKVFGKAKAQKQIEEIKANDDEIRAAMRSVTESIEELKQEVNRIHIAKEESDLFSGYGFLINWKQC